MTAFVLAASGSAFAADIAAKAPPPAPAPVYNWTGWYVGGNLGVSFGTSKTDFNVAPGSFAAVNAAGPLTATIPGFAGTDFQYPGGFIGGGQIGFNWQLYPQWVVGAEADFQGADEKEHSTFTQAFSASCAFEDMSAAGLDDPAIARLLRYAVEELEKHPIEEFEEYGPCSPPPKIRSAGEMQSPLAKIV